MQWVCFIVVFFIFIFLAASTMPEHSIAPSRCRQLLMALLGTSKRNIGSQIYLYVQMFTLVQSFVVFSQPVLPFLLNQKAVIDS